MVVFLRSIMINNMETNKEYVVIAEDSAPNRMILTHVIKKLGYEVIESADGSLAWTELENGTGKNIVAVFSDFMMPNMDGMALLRKIRGTEKYKALPFVLVTALSNQEWVKEAQSLSCSAAIIKPANKEKVIKVLKTIFPEKTFI